MRKHSIVFNLTIKDLRELGIIKSRSKNKSKCVYNNKMIQNPSFQAPNFINRYSTENSLSNVQSQYIDPNSNLKKDNIDVPNDQTVFDNSYQPIPAATLTTPVDTSVFEIPVELPAVKQEQPKPNITTELSEIPPPSKKIRITIPLDTYIKKYKALGGNDPAILTNKKQTAKMYKMAILDLEGKLKSP